MTDLSTPPALPASGGSADPRPYRWTLAEYRSLDRLDAFRDQRTLLLDGEVYVMPPAGPPHDVALELTAEFLRAVFAVGHFVRVQMGFDIGTRTDPSPDVAVVVGRVRDHRRQTPRSAVLAVEVAESSLLFDTTTKAEVYTTAGVPDYWVVDVAGRRLHVFRDLYPIPAGGHTYRTRLTLGPADAVSPLAAPAATIPVADLLP
jgi:Uma2 family endonuclease